VDVSHTCCQDRFAGAGVDEETARMSFTAVWPVDDPDDPDAAELATVDTADEVDALLTRLAATSVGPAVIEHQSRDFIEDVEGLLGTPGEARIPDHDVTAAVRQGYGYLSYADPGHAYATSAGEPSSPGFSSEHAEYPPGSGVPLDVLAGALKEFLTTAERPTGVSWRET
jgi:hypothetical protein